MALNWLPFSTSPSEATEYSYVFSRRLIKLNLPRSSNSKVFTPRLLMHNFSKVFTPRLLMHNFSKVFTPRLLMHNFSKVFTPRLLMHNFSKVFTPWLLMHNFSKVFTPRHAWFCLPEHQWVFESSVIAAYESLSVKIWISKSYSHSWKGSKYTKMLENQIISVSWRFFLKNSTQFNSSGQTRASWTTITKQKNTHIMKNKTCPALLKNSSLRSCESLVVLTRKRRR